jgi:hypothetical protein
MNEGVMTKDAPGNDLADIPRYPDSKRIMSIACPESGAMLLYQSPHQPQEVAAHYRKSMQAIGWKILQDFDSGFVRRLVPDAPAELGTNLLIFERNRDIAVVNINTMVSSTQEPYTLVSIAKNMMREFGYVPPVAR